MNALEADDGSSVWKEVAPLIDAAIDRSQKGIVGDFLNRYKK